MSKKKEYQQASNFVSPAPIQRTEIVHLENLPPAPIVDPYPFSSYRDKSHGFVLATAPLAVATGFVVLLIAIAAFGVPVLSIMALLVALGGFTIAWLIAYALHVFVSADGALFYHAVMTWRLLFLEARERRKRYGNRKQNL